MSIFQLLGAMGCIVAGLLVCDELPQKGAYAVGIIAGIMVATIVIGEVIG